MNHGRTTIDVNTATTICLKCGLEQDPEKPICVHMVGKKGGKRASSTQDMREIGRKGGEATRKKGPEFYQAIGKKGGDAVKARRGRDFYEEIGRKGGEELKARRGDGYFEMIGTKGGARTKELCKMARELKEEGAQDEGDEDGY